MSNLSKHKKLAKALTAVTSFATALSMSGVVYLAPVAALAVAPSDYGLKEGWTISAAGSSDPDIYIVNDWGYKRLFLNPAIFNFYGHLGGFAAVHNVNPSVRDAFMTSGLFRNCETNDQKVYGVESTGEDVGMLHWVNTSGSQAVIDDPNFFKKVFCINNNEFSWYPKGSDYTSVNQVPNYTRTDTVQTAGNVSVSLASSNPASGTIVDGQARYHLASFMFSGNGMVTQLKLKRTGVSADASLTNVYLYDGAKRLTDSVTVSNSEIYFNDSSGLFNATGGKVVSVLADIDGTAGETVGVQAISVNGSAISVSGNLHTIATATDADVTMSSTTTPSADGSPVPADDFNAWQNAVTIGNRYVWLKSVQFRVVGSVLPGDLQNFRLYVDGAQAGSAVSQQDSNGYVVFDLSNSPVKLDTGTRTLKVLVNIVNGSSRTFYLSLRQKADLWTVDSQYNSAVLASGTFPVSSTSQTIASGTLTITKTNDSPSGDVVKDASAVTLGRWEVKSAGEKMKVESLRFDFDSSDNNMSELRNGAIFLDGVQIGSTADLKEVSEATGYTEYTFGSSFIVVPGTPRMLEVRADVYDGDSSNNAWAGGETIQARVDTSDSNVQRLTSLTYIDCSYDGSGNSGCSTGPVSANTLTVRTGSLSVGKYTGYANQSVVAPKNGVKLGHWTVAAASSEDVNINTVDITQGTAGGAGDFTFGDVTDAYIKVWNDAGSVIYTSPIKSTLSTSASNSYSTSFVLPKNKTYQVEFYGNVGSSLTAGNASVISQFDVTGVTTGSSTTSNVARSNGQTISAASGTISFANGQLSVAALRAGGSTANTYQFTVTPAYDDYYLDEVYVDLSSTTASAVGAVTNLVLKDGSTTLATTTVNSSTGSASFTGLNLALPQLGGAKTLSVDAQFANVGVGGNDTYGLVLVRLDGYKHRNSSGTVNTTTGLSTSTFAGNANRVVKAYPVFTNSTLTDTTLTTGDKKLWKSAVSTVGGNVGLAYLKWDIQTTNGPTFSGDDTTWKLFANGVDITALGTFSSASATDLATAGAHTGYVQFAFTAEYVVSSTVTLELQGNVTAVGSNFQSVSTKIANPKSTAATSSDDAVTTAALSSSLPTSTSSSVVWSDKSAVSHALTTDDWMNDYLLQTINAAQTVYISQ